PPLSSPGLSPVRSWCGLRLNRWRVLLTPQAERGRDRVTRRKLLRRPIPAARQHRAKLRVHTEEIISIRPVRLRRAVDHLDHVQVLVVVESHPVERAPLVPVDLLSVALPQVPLGPEPLQHDPPDLHVGLLADLLNRQRVGRLNHLLRHPDYSEHGTGSFQAQAAASERFTRAANSARDGLEAREALTRAR